MAPPDDPFGAALRGEWALDPDIAHLNHGSFGAAPKAVLAAQAEWRARLERNPSGFMDEELPEALAGARRRLAAFLACDPDALAFVDNATTGSNAVVRAWDLKQGDEVLTTDQVYPALRNLLRFVCARAGARLVEAPVALPVRDEDSLLRAVESGFTARTRYAAFDHVTSHSAVVYPLARLLALARARRVPVLVDGAHAPGMVPVDLGRLDAAWYVGNGHKWLCAPKGCGFLWASEGAREGLHPAVISHGLGQGFRAEFDWTGTKDPSPWLALPAALDFLARFGLDKVRARNRALCLRAAAMLAAEWGTAIAAPATMRASMATIALPECVEGDAVALRRILRHRHRIEAPVHRIGGRPWVRISAQLYNEMPDYERLAAAIAAESRVTSAARHSGA